MLQQILPSKLTAHYFKRTILLFTFPILCLFSKTDAQTIYVDSSVTVSGDGSSWANAYKELRDALMAIRTNSAITEINVARGTYKPTDDANVDSAFCIYRGNIKIYGGYPTGGGSRNINANQVNLDGLNEDPIYSSYHVFIVAGLPPGADSVVLDGLTITGGNAIRGG